METEWLRKYYKSLGWNEHRITDFLQRAVVNEESKKKEVEKK